MVVAVVAGVVTGLGALAGGDEDPGGIADAPGSSDDAVAVTSAAVSSAAGDEPGDPSQPSVPDASAVSTDVAPTADSGSGGPDGRGVPTADDPAVVYIAGDSDAGTFGPYLQELLSESDIVATELDYKVSSGLSRPDFFDWPERFAAGLTEVDPDIVVVTFGGNDAQGLADRSGDFIVGQPDSDTADWKREYGERVGRVMDQLSADGRTLIWVGIPNDDNPKVTSRLQVQDEVVRAEAGERPDVVFVDTWERFSGRNGGWAEYVIDPRDNQGKDVRAGDGFHLNEVGAEILALDIAEAIRADLRDRGADV